MEYHQSPFALKIFMDQKLRKLLQELEEHGRENDARVSERPRMMLNLDPASAQLVSILVRASGVTRPTIWLAPDGVSAWHILASHKVP